MKKIIIIFCALFVVAQSYAVKRYVRMDGPQIDGAYTSWETAASNIQVAIDIAIAGDEIIVTNGTYVPNDSAGFVVTSGIELKSVNGADYTIIDGGGTKRGLSIDSIGDVADGFTIRNAGAGGGNGGGVYCVNGLIKNCLITDNAAIGASGGGIYFNNNGRAENCIIKNNNSDSQGGGIFFGNGGTLLNCLVVSNSAPDGGGIYFNNTGTVQNCTVVMNSANGKGGGAYALNGGAMINSIIYFNTCDSGSNVYNILSSALLTYCCVAPLPAGEGNILTGPTFFNEANERFQLNRGSSCINVGTNLSWMAGAFDLDGNPRIVDGTVDIGAYEYIPPFVNITSDNVLVSYDFNEIVILGTNNPFVAGGMQIENLSSSFDTFFPANQNWAVSNVSLSVGFNDIVVEGTNRYGISTNDIVTIERGGVGTGLPYVNITNNNQLLSYDFAKTTIGGTNNIHVMGSQWWTNTFNGKYGFFVTAQGWDITDIDLDVGINEVLVYGSNYWNQTTNDVINIERGGIGTGNPFVDITNDISLIPTSVNEISLVGTNNIHVVGLSWQNINTGSNGLVLITGAGTSTSSWISSNIPLVYGDNEIVVTASNKWDVTSSDSIVITRNIDTNNVGVLCTWPNLIGADQTGTVEFVSPDSSEWRLISGSNEVASGFCTAGWNLVEFSAENLPVKLQTGSNLLELAIGAGLVFDAGKITVMETDLKTKDPKAFIKDLDDDQIYVKYTSKTGDIYAQGRTIFIENGSVKDKLIVKVKAAKGTGDGVCRISGIICNGDLGMVKIPGTLDKLIVNGVLKKVMLKGGVLGHDCKTKLHNVRFKSDAGKSQIKVMAGKNKKDKTTIPADVFANVLCGELMDDGSIEPEILKAISIVGGNLGIENVKRKLDAEAIGSVLVKAKKDIGGDIVDYSFYLTGEEKQGKGMSVKKVLANNIIDSTTSNSYFICGYDTEIKTNSFPYEVFGTNWLNHIVNYNFGKIIIKGSDLNGTFVIKDWAPKKGKVKQVKAKIAGTDDATWIVNQTIDKD